jgi:hypothetical protein
VSHHAGSQCFIGELHRQVAALQFAATTTTPCAFTHRIFRKATTSVVGDGFNALTAFSRAPDGPLW